MKRLVVLVLVRACSVIHHIPIWREQSGCRLAGWSCGLDERWGTEVWH